jgi:hypothetical protein
MPVRLTVPTKKLTAETEQQIRLRIAQDVLLEASAEYLEHRAAMFEWAMSYDGDHPGLMSPNDRRGRDDELAGIARALRRKAWLIRTREIWHG